MILTESAGTFLRRRWRQKVPDPDPYPPKSPLNIVQVLTVRCSASHRKYEDGSEGNAKLALTGSSGQLTNGLAQPAILLIFRPLEYGASRLLTLATGQ